MLRNNKSNPINILVIAIVCVLLSYAAQAQTSGFTYQGTLNDSSSLANGPYDFSFKLYDSSNFQIGSVVLRDDVPVTNGVFAVSLDFGVASFDGGTRFLEISVRPGASTSAYVALTPKQPVTSAPYAVKSITAGTADTATNATQLGGVSANQFTQTNDSRLTDARNPLPNSPSYIQNTTAAQASSNFNVSGNGTAGGILSGNTVNSTTQYNIGGQPVFRAGNSSVYAGLRAGESSVLGASGPVANTFVGQSAGVSNVTGSWNSFFGNAAGFRNTATENSFVGVEAGYRNTTGTRNSFFGREAGGGIGIASNITGNENTFFGYKTGTGLTTGSGNTLIGSRTEVGNSAVSNATAIGVGAIVSQTGAIVLGTPSAHIGMGTSTPANKLTVVDPGTTGLRVENLNAGGTVASFGPLGDFNVDGGVPGGRLSIKENGTVIVAACPTCFAGVPDRFVVEGSIRLMGLAGGGSQAVCRNSVGQLSGCSSSLRYKTDITPYRPGLDLVKKLQPISFRWKADGMADLGLGAETVADVEPLLVTNNDSGEVEGVKYDRVAVVLLNAVKEQQAQIELQQKRIEDQQTQLDKIMRVVSMNRRVKKNRRNTKQ